LVARWLSEEWLSRVPARSEGDRPGGRSLKMCLCSTAAVDGASQTLRKLSRRSTVGVAPARPPTGMVAVVPRRADQPRGPWRKPFRDGSLPTAIVRTRPLSLVGGRECYSLMKS